MRHLDRDTRALLRAVERSERRSSLFWWFVEHHDDFQSAIQQGRVDWVSFCAKTADLGLTDTRGLAPTRRNARETWRQARKTVAEARAQQAVASVQPRRVGATPPSRISKDWRPSGFGQPPLPASAVSPAQSGRQATADEGFRPPMIDDGRPRDPSPEYRTALLNYLMGRGPKPPPPLDRPMTAEEQLRDLRGTMNLRSGRRWDDPGDYPKKD